MPFSAVPSVAVWDKKCMTNDCVVVVVTFPFIASQPAVHECSFDCVTRPLANKPITLQFPDGRTGNRLDRRKQKIFTDTSRNTNVRPLDFSPFV